jgi:hypothetical protein
VIEEGAVREMREVWRQSDGAQSTFSSDLLYGQQNYSHTFFGAYTRHFEFYWNKPTHALTRDVSLLLHYARNVVTSHHPAYGLVFAPGRVGVYLAVTHYPTGTGEMAVHVDPNYFLPVHFNVPLSFKGLDYQNGGLMIHTPAGQVDVEARLRPGSIVLFKGSIPHSVARISGGGTASSLGRIQMFSIPTEFHQEKKRGTVRDLAIDAYGRFKYFMYRRGRGYRTDHKNFR